MYFIYGEELFLINKEIKIILKQNKEANPIFFDEENSIYEIVNEINTFSIFDDSKIIIIRNFSLLKKSNPIYETEMINSIENKNKNCILIFIYCDESPKTKTNFFTYLLKHSQTIQVKKYTHTELVPIIQEIVEYKGGKIANINAILLSTKLPNDLNLIIQEIDKLLLENNEISKEMILVSVSKYNSNDIFEFINSFQDGDISGLFRSYKEKMDDGETIVNLIAQLSNTLILCSDINSYKLTGKRIEEISIEMKLHLYRIKKANELLKKFTFKKIEKLIGMLSKLDNDIKQGKVDEVIGFEKLLLEIIR